MPQDSEAIDLFRPELVAVFRRLRKVTLEEIKLRLIAFGMFTFTFFNIILYYYSAASAIAVALGISAPKDWRPCFGSLRNAYCLKKIWGKVWHQHLRQFL
ncbi:hypothetical protein K491DRAFT_322068 [Lophiostoma macrostomum CBS 122681]|uniref:Wax synthase domain-containing protein n=1 Tax=Lophiostoma macrostomum CBS 122681 TaxID=1314788 RepID=A0A6A6SM56_9PLEO|nr:hypothetical protein K491DRAFT_322068 [Lophiostoma macrostomum CBS 122681]